MTTAQGSIPSSPPGILSPQQLVGKQGHIHVAPQTCHLSGTWGIPKGNRQEDPKVTVRRGKGVAFVPVLGGRFVGWWAGGVFFPQGNVVTE